MGPRSVSRRVVALEHWLDTHHDITLQCQCGILILIGRRGLRTNDRSMTLGEGDGGGHFTEDKRFEDGAEDLL